MKQAKMDDFLGDAHIDTWVVEDVYRITRKARSKSHEYVIIVIRNLRTQKAIKIKDKMGYGTGKLDWWNARKGIKFKIKNTKQVSKRELFKILMDRDRRASNIPLTKQSLDM
jgi:hypothetical protein